MTDRFKAFAASVLLGLVATGSAHAEIAGGQIDDGSVRDNVPSAGVALDLLAYLTNANISRLQALAEKAQRRSAGSELAATINFDAAAAPCLFSDTGRLTGSYQGAFFFAPAGKGGAILDDCSNFGVSPTSMPNFLAFNSTASSGDGTIPILPEIVVVPGGASNVRMNYSGGSLGGDTIAFIAIGSGGVQDVQVVQTPTSSWNAISLNGNSITLVIVAGQIQYLVIDDIVAN